MSDTFALNRAAAKFVDIGVKVVAFSVDDEATTMPLLAKKYAIHFPVGCGADSGAAVATTGASVDAEPSCLQATGFVLAARGSVFTAANGLRRYRTAGSRRAGRYVVYFKSKALKVAEDSKAQIPGRDGQSPRPSSLAQTLAGAAPAAQKDVP